MLFLLGCDDECKHESMTKKVTEPDCNKGGYVTYECDNCEYSYTAEYTDPKKHTLHKTVVDPTCESAGYTSYSCECGYSYKDEITSPLGHNYTGVTTAPTCTENGYAVYTCKTCNDSYTSDYTSAAGHTLVSEVTEPDCENQGYTSVSCSCGYSYIVDYKEPLGHSYTENVVSVADCTNKGEITYTCECGDTYTLITPPLEHAFSKVVTAPTLSDVGYTDFICQRCDFSYQGDYRFYSEILSDAYADGTEVLHKGIDISYHNYSLDSNGDYISLDFDSINAAGIDYVIIRLGDAAIGLDPTFEKSYTDAKAAGLDVGAYFYTRATTKDEILREANLILSALDGKQFEYPIYLDLEDESLSSLSAQDLNELCFAFFTRLQRAGYYTGLYVNHEWLYNHIDTDTALSKFEIWYARYPLTENGEEPTWNTEKYGNAFGMWQYTDSGYIDGIDGVKFDFNYSFKDYPNIIKNGGFNGYDTDIKFPDSDKSFVWVIHSGAINVRSSADYFLTDDYDATADIIGYAHYQERFEVVEFNEKYTAIIFNGEVAYITANPLYISYTGIYN